MCGAQSWRGHQGSRRYRCASGASLTRTFAVVNVMADKQILHMVTPLKHMSPFDANMALDAGYDAVLTYANVTLEEVSGLVQDAMFSRPPKTGVRTGLFVGGKNAILALDMLSAAKK